MDRVVMMVTMAESKTITVAKPIPACPVTQLRRMNNITPHMFSKHLTYMYVCIVEHIACSRDVRLQVHPDFLLYLMNVLQQMLCKVMLKCDYIVLYVL